VLPVTIIMVAILLFSSFSGSRSVVVFMVVVKSYRAAIAHFCYKKPRRGNLRVLEWSMGGAESELQLDSNWNQAEGGLHAVSPDKEQKADLIHHRNSFLQPRNSAFSG
jgi:hypothetical protein